MVSMRDIEKGKKSKTNINHVQFQVTQNTSTRFLLSPGTVLIASLEVTKENKLEPKDDVEEEYSKDIYCVQFLNGGIQVQISLSRQAHAV